MGKMIIIGVYRIGNRVPEKIKVIEIIILGEKKRSYMLYIICY